ncbi:hypothetical protein [Bacteroides reticulotermitis]|nr:hypothetical protein [Bacteroides reticulotermitis]MBB4045295.1 hypothetical protein [Bacteroides reticulotermitis]
MEKRFLHIVALLTITSMVFYGCNDDNEILVDSNVNVTLSVSVKGSSRMVGPVAEGSEPLIDHIWGGFLKDGVIVVKQQITLVNGIAVFKNIPNFVNKVILLGYPDASSTSPTVSSSKLMESDLLQTMIEASSQDGTNPRKVNTFGTQVVDFSAYQEGDKVNVTIEMRPVISRLEIVKIDPADPPAGLIIKKPITQFDLDAIYINNTYTSLGLNRITKPGTSATLAYGGGDLTGSTSPWGNPTSNYMPGFYDVINGIGESSYAPTIGVWGYYIVPLSDKNGMGQSVAGTTINGEQQGVVPHVILKLSNIKVEGSGEILTGPLFLTVRRYQDTNGPVMHFEGGKAYVIQNLAFGLEHLSVLPETNFAEYVVQLSTIDWTDVTIEQDV